MTAPPASALAALRAFAERAGAAPPEVTSGPAAAFRHRARLAIRGRAGTPKLGIFEENSHRVVHIPQCVVHHPRVNEVAAAVRRTLAEQRTPSYSDGAHAGIARYLAVTVERESGAAQVVLVTSGDYLRALEPVFASLQRELGPRLHSLWHNAQPERSNVILGPRFEHVSGPEYVSEAFGGARVFYPPGAFGQSNLALFEELVLHVRAQVPSGSRVLELYAGVGAIGMGLVEQAERVVFNEVGEHSLSGLRRGLSALAPELAARTTVAPGLAAEHGELIAQSNVVIADPPRKGLEPEVVATLIRHRPARFVYVSCGLPALLNQGQELVDAGFRLENLRLFDLFPFTEHVEVVATFAPR